MPTTSQAAVMVGENFEIREYPVPDPEPRSLLLRTELAGICGTDLHNWKHQRLEGEVLLGHENVGIIEKQKGVAEIQTIKTSSSLQFQREVQVITPLADGHGGVPGHPPPPRGGLARGAGLPGPSSRCPPDRCGAHRLGSAGTTGRRGEQSLSP